MANPPSRKDAWKAAASSKGSAQPVDQAWRNAKEQIRQDPPWWKSRWARLTFATSASLVLGVLIVVVISLLRPAKPIHLVLIRAGYEDSLAVPLNVAGRKSLDDLNQLAEDHGKWKGQVSSVELDGDTDAVKRAVEVSALGKAPEKVVVFLSAHGVVAENGLAPCLVCNGDDLSKRSALYQFDQLLDTLAALPPDTQKLLLVDATGVRSHWPLGELHNDFIQALESRREKMQAIPNLLVITSSDKDQRSWVSPEWGQTVFAHFVIEGLRGAADHESDPNQRVSADELYLYVAKHVKRWAWHNRHQVQTPVLLCGTTQQAKKMEVVDCPGYKPGEEPVPPVEQEQPRVYEDLRKAWSDCRKREKESPHPAVYTPHLWRRYLDTLLRAEQLLRAGDTERTAKLLESRKTLEERIQQARALKRDSMQLTLGMPAALGLRLTANEEKELARIAKLWQENGAKEDYEKAITGLLALAGQDRPRRQMLRATLACRVVSDMARDPQHRLTEGRPFLETLEADPPYCRPAEVHYLMMLRPESEAGKPSPIDPLLEKKRWPLLQKSLEARLLAEQAALGLRAEDDDKQPPAYSEQVLPWIRQTIEDADKSRRLGQDLLFTSLTASWDEADKLLEDARKGYENAQTIAGNLRRAFTVRDRSLTELPYYTRWVVAQETEKEQFLVDLWGQLHALSRALEAPPTGGATIEQTAKLDKQAREIASASAKLRDSLRNAARRENPHNQDRWHEIEAILSVPFVDPDDRVILLTASREISRDLFVNPGKDGEADGVGVEGNTKQARTLALRNGRLALAVLGDDWPESATLKAELNNTDEDTWHRHLTHAGHSVGQLLNRLPEEADKLCEQAAKTDDLDAAAVALRIASRYARTIPGAPVETRMTRDPVGEQRRLQLYRLLYWQARRTFLDWWAERKTGPDTIPYFKRAADIFRRDAEEVLTGKTPTADGVKLSKRLQEVADLRELLRAPTKVLVEMGVSTGGPFKPGPAQLNLTDDGSQERFYRLRGPEAATVPGTPVLWVEGQPGLQVIAEEKERKAVQFGPPKAYPIKIGEDRSAPHDKGVPRHVVHGFFRGHRSEVVTEVHMYRVPNVTLSLPLRQGGGNVAVQTKQSLYALYGAENTAISLVLDCSGSMNYPRPEKGPRRFDKAVQTLRGVLTKLPEGVWVSLRAFGAETFTERDDLPDKGGIRLVWEAHKWNPDNLDNRMAKVTALKPAYTTPLLRSIRMASRDFPRRQFESRTIVVITDGGDSNFNVEDIDADLKRASDARTIKDYVKYLKKEFDDTGIQLIVIGFDVKKGQLPSKAEETAYLELRQAMKDLGGAYHDAENADKLRELLRRSLLRLYFRVDPDFGSPISDLGAPGGPISQTDLGEVPHYVAREPGHYLVRIPATRKLQQLIALGSGDALLLDLVRNPESDRPAFRRTQYAESDLVTRHGRDRVPKAPRVDDWLLAVWQNQQFRDKNSLQMMATLEKDEGIVRGSGPLQQVWPEWHWFEVPAAEKGAAAPTLRVGRVSNYPAPTWGIDLPRWAPWGAPVTLKAWWREKLPKPHGTLVQGPDFRSPFELVNYNWPTDAPPGSVLLESMKIETQRLKVVEGGPEEEVDCLMVRLSYPPDKGPFFVRWPGWEGSQEHRFYTEAGKYTGIFWTRSRDMKEIAEKELKRLDLYSVAELKTGASQVKELKVGTPNDVWERPTPAPPIRYNRP